MKNIGEMIRNSVFKVFYGHYVTFLLVCLLAVSASMARAVLAPNGESEASRAVHRSNQLRLASAFRLKIRDNSLRIIDGANVGIADRLLNWREALFLGAPQSQSGGVDLYRAKVQLGRDREVIGVQGLKNLTNSPAGQVSQLELSWPLCAVTTEVFGQIRSVKLFDFSGQPLANGESWSLGRRLLARVSQKMSTGRWRGIGQVTLRFKQPPKSVSYEFVQNDDDRRFSLAWIDKGERAHGALVNLKEDAFEIKNLFITKQVHLPKNPILWAVDTVRSLDWIGPGPIEWLEGRFFALKDRWKRLAYRWTASPEEDESVTPQRDAVVAEQTFEVPSGLEVGVDKEPTPWPPEPIPAPVFSRLRVNEGIWRPEVPKFAKADFEASGQPPLVYKTYTRPDLLRPYVHVRLFAMDMRRLDLHMVAGHEDPKPTTGNGGDGRFPRRRDVLPRIVLAFNGAFKTEHGAYGMMVERNVLIPPKDKAATIATFDSRLVAMGSWPAKMSIPPDMLSYRQNMDPLVEDLIVNPRRRYLWGFTLSEDITEMNTIRSGICMTEAGTLIYAWGEDLTAKTLGIAMKAARCVYGIHLDMNPFHTAFIHYRFPEDVDLERPEFESELAVSQMMYSAFRYVRGAPKDFFFLTRKRFAPDGDWSSEALAQPAPALIPAVFSRHVDGCDLIALDRQRVQLSLVAGEVPTSVAATAKSNAAEVDLHNLILHLDLGRWSAKRGQMVNGIAVGKIQASGATLGIADSSAADGGRLFLGPWPEGPERVAALKDAVQSRWLLVNGTALLGDARQVVAIAELDEQWLIIARGPSDRLAQRLANMGARQAISFIDDAAASPIFIRGQQGMMDLNRKAINKIDPHSAALRVWAKSTRLGMKRMKNIFSIAEQHVGEDSR